MEPEIQNNLDLQIINNTIKAIDRESVHKICSGQVVLTLAIAVKELVENSIDAGATIIDISLKEYGADLIEVSDNGSGVLKENFQALTLKHYTSKIREFSDLESIGTLGFRGEALSSLCALCSSLTIVTRHSTTEFATKIDYDNNGKIISESLCSRQQGTTVSLENLFSTLPVRRKEFMKNLKREFNKMCQVLYGYCLISKGIKFRCSNQTNKGFRSTVVSTEGSKTVRENIISIFGAKQISSLIDVEIVRPGEQQLNDYSIKLSEEEELPFNFEFLISSVLHGNGRSINDRQFYFINSRPCEPTKIIKLINEIYKKYNANQFPFVYLNIISKSCLVDVNVTPDKRQIFLEKEKYLLATLHSSLHEAFKAFPSTYKVQNTELSQNITTIFDDNKEETVNNKSVKRSFKESGVGVSKTSSIFEKYQKRSKTSKEKSVENNLDISKEESVESKEDSDKKLDAFIEIACKLSKKIKDEQLINFKPNKIEKTVQCEVKESNCVEIVETALDRTVKKPSFQKTINYEISLDSIKESLAKCKKKNEENDNIKVRFRSKIVPEANKSAEEELQKQITKNDFKNMEIIGQFNLGFIITRLNSDLFIIDQHASDEKYNFEQLQMNTVLENQLLVNPKPLELTAGNESLLIENIEIFRKNGFAFNIDSSAPCTKKVSLTAIPISKNFAFGKDDIDEMLFMLQDSSHTMCRPSRVRTMFASRACRKSVMIGKSLSKNDMRKLVEHMSEIEQPWNCPHGRPTMRHLINLDLIHKE